jgi:hypothetical protein
VIALLGRFKGELGENYYLLPIVTVTSSGINNWLWIGRLLDEYKKLNINSGPLFRNKMEMGARLEAEEYEPRFFDCLEQVQATRPVLIPSTDDIPEEYGIYWSFRWGSTLEATNKGLAPDILDANNQWRKFNKARASRPSLSMREYYADIQLMLNQSLKYSAIGWQSKLYFQVVLIYNCLELKWDGLPLLISLIFMIIMPLSCPFHP